MNTDFLKKANALSQTIVTLKNIVTAVEAMVGLTDEQKAGITAEVRKHLDDVQKQFDTL